MADSWETVDALLLSAIATAGRRGADLRRMVDEEDYINRMVYHRHEIEGALQRLIGSDLVSEANGHFSLTASGLAIRKRAPRGSVHERLRWIREFLAERIDCTSATEWSLAPYAYESAVADHRREMAALREQDPKSDR